MRRFLAAGFALVCALAGALSATGLAEARGEAWDRYETVECESITAPSTANGNMNFIFSMSRNITSRTLTDMQRMTKASFAGSLSQTEIELFYKFGLITLDKQDSLLYKIQFGCPEYNGSTDMDSIFGNPLDPQDTVEGVELFDLAQIQRKVEGSSPASQRMLVVQVHMVTNNVQLVLKGDDPVYSIMPDPDQVMFFRLKAGLKFPNGTAIKEDVTFRYDPVTKLWTDLDQIDWNTYEDETLGNQGGYTDEELSNMEGA